MNSETSSDSEYENFNNFRTNCFRGAPFYPTLGQPLIYYAEIKPKKRSRRNKENEKNKSNCFAKAFRWYTQEHAPLQNNPSSNDTNYEDINGFASWLDEKYNEYLQTSKIEQNQCILSQISTVQVINNAEIVDHKASSSKKIPKIKSPWHKRAKSLITRDKAGDFTVKSNQSIKVILKSKNLSRAVSACCQRSDLQTRNKSNGSVISDMSALRMKFKPIHKSLTSVLKEKEIYVIPFEVLQDANHTDMKDKVNKLKMNNKKKIKQIFPKQDTLSNIQSQSKKHVRCQCFNDTLQKIDISKNIEKRTASVCHCEEFDAGVDVSHKVTTVIPRTCTKTKYHTSSSVPPISSAMQTSDYTISLENDVCRKVPLFMKVCACNLKKN